MVAATAGTADGYIRIDTSIDSKGFNKGVSNMSKGFSKLGQTLKTVFKALSVGALLIFGVALRNVFQSVRDSVSSLINTNLKGSQLAKDIEGVKGQFTELKYSVAAAFLPLIQAAIPYIKMALTWLTELFNKVAMITAAFTGQTEVVQVVAGSAGDLAKNTEKAKKAAQGALAAFDQINVLSQGDTGAAATPTSDMPQVMTRMVPVTDEILAKVQKIKDEIAAWWNDPIGKIQETWANIASWFKTNVTDPIGEWWASTWLGQTVIEAWNNIRDNFIAPFLGGAIELVSGIMNLFSNLWAIITNDSMSIPEKIRAVWQTLVDWFTNSFVPALSLIFTAVGNALMMVFSPLIAWFQENFITPLMNIFTGIWEGVRVKALAARDAVAAVWFQIVAWFKTNVTDPVKAVFFGAVDFVRISFTNAFTAIQDFVKGIINNIIGFVNSMISSIIGGINAVIDAANSVSSILPGYNPIGNVTAPQIPQLASGAVIPPNARFAAILGDQKAGNNLEAPESLLRQIVREESGGSGNNITITFDGSLSELARVLKPHIDTENSRVGGSLVKGSVE